MILALKPLELSVTYAIWSGVGTALAAMIGIAYFREPFTLFKLASIAARGRRRGRALSSPAGRATDGFPAPR